MIFMWMSHVYADNILSPIVVGASVSPIDIHSSPASVDILTSKDIKKSGFRDVASLLNTISSISISATGGIGQTTSIFTRGTESNHTKIILDGVELNPGTLGLAPIQNIPIHLIDKIEIIKGTSSSLYGANSIGGIINIITKKNVDAITLSTGSWATNSMTLHKALNYNNLNIQLNVNSQESKSFPTKISSSKKHGYNSNDILFGIDHYSKNYSFTSKIYTSDGNTQYDSFGSNLNQDHNDHFYNVDIKKFINLNTLNFKYTKTQNKISQAASDATDFTKTLRNKYDLSYILINKHFVNKIGVTYTKEHMSELSYGTRYITDPIIRELYYQEDVFNHDGNVNYGIRFINHSQFGNFTLGNVGISFKKNKDVYSFNINKAFRAPDATDLYGYGGNDKLLPEKSLSFEFNLKTFLNNNSIFQTSLYKTQIKNLIEADINSVQYIAEAEITGLEMNYKYITKLLNYKFSYNYMIPKDKTNNQNLSKRSKHKLNVNVAYMFNNNNSLNLDIISEGTRKATPYYNIDMGSYYVANLNYNFTTINSSVNFSLKNLFNRKYRNSHNYNTANRSFFITYSYDY